ncbi:MAG: type IV pili methyl-accepting chemotaxis transducer N-terminal domain-containing protein [Campylobacterota bacterium]
MTLDAHTKTAGKVFAGVLITLMMSAPASAKITSATDAVNMAGKQRMITQRMLKDYALIGMNNTYGDPQTDLPKMVALFDKNLNELQAYLKDKPSLKSLSKVAVLWAPIKKSLGKAPSIDKVAALQRDLEALLNAAHESTGLIAKASGSTAGKTVNMAGRQRMLSQRMASLYMLRVWGVEDPEFSKKLSTAMDEFSSAHKKLLASPLNTDEINTLLAKSGKAFKFFEMMGKTKSNKFVPSLINRSANKILTNMNTATGLYSSK